MSFGQQIAKYRKQQQLSQQALADKAGLKVLQVRRYETDATKPNLDAIRQLALALHVSSDDLVFDDSERMPKNNRLLMLFEGVSALDSSSQEALAKVVEDVLFAHGVKK